MEETEREVRQEASDHAVVVLEQKVAQLRADTAAGEVVEAENLSLRRRVEEVLEGTARAHGCRGALSWLPDPYPPTRNDPALFASLVRRAPEKQSSVGGKRWNAMRGAPRAAPRRRARAARFRRSAGDGAPRARGARAAAKSGAAGGGVGAGSAAATGGGVGGAGATGGSAGAARGIVPLDAAPCRSRGSLAESDAMRPSNEATSSPPRRSSASSGQA